MAARRCLFVIFYLMLWHLTARKVDRAILRQSRTLGRSTLACTSQNPIDAMTPVVTAMTIPEVVDNGLSPSGTASSLTAAVL
jgi:hypothetical protein